MDADIVQSRGLINANLEVFDKIDNYKVSNATSTKNIRGADLNVQPLGKTLKVDTLPIENLCDGSSKRKKKKRRKCKKAKKGEGQSLNQDNIDTQSMDITVEGNDNIKKLDIKEVLNVGQIRMDTGLVKNVAEGNGTVKNAKIVQNPKIQDESQSLDQQKMHTLQPAEILAQGNVSRKRRKKRKKSKKAKLNIEVLSETHTRLTENLAERNVSLQKLEIIDEVQNEVQMDTGPTENATEGNVTINNPKSQDEVEIFQEKMDRGPAQNFSVGNVTLKRKKKRKKKKAKVPEEVSSRMGAGSMENLAGVSIGNSETRDEVHNTDLKLMDAESIEIISKGNMTTDPKNKDEGERMDTGPAKDFTNKHVKRKRNRRSKKITKNIGESTSQDQTNLSISVNGLTDAPALWLKTAMNSFIRRKLLVLDINGLLADIVYPAPKHCKGDTKICGRAVFRRPFYDDFLKFCFQNFDVGIWSSRSKKIVDKVVDYLLKDQKYKLQFCWDMTHSTQTGFKTLENRHKPLVCKELRKIWENDDLNCPWKKGDYDESNTLLLDDSPYKALLNPLHTAIFPCPYQYPNKKDNSLGPEGDIRVYLEGLVTCENVQKYVEQHPFGQKPITEQNLSWEFYKQILEQMSNPVNDKIPIPSETCIAQEAFLVA